MNKTKNLLGSDETRAMDKKESENITAREQDKYCNDVSIVQLVKQRIQYMHRSRAAVYKAESPKHKYIY